MIVEQLAGLLDQLGAAWILYLLLGLSVLSVAVVIERILFLRRNFVPVIELQGRLLTALDQGRDEALAILQPYSGMAATVVSAGVEQMHRGASAVGDIMQARESLERQRYERYLGFLGSLGANAPFIGLLGTVIGIMGAFADLEMSMAAAEGANRAQAIMGSISEALVATAVGLLVAIPAVIAYNQLKGRVKVTMQNTEALASMLLAWLKTRDDNARDDSARDDAATAPAER